MTHKKLPCKISPLSSLLTLSLSISFLVAGAVTVHSQPTLSLPAVNATCRDTAVLVNGAPDTLVSAPDSEGFVSLFDGKTLKGWWENCKTTHSSQDRTNGGIWIADSLIGAIYAQQADNLAGSVLLTNKSYGNYELILDFWPTFGNDAGIFNRMVPSGSTAGRTFQTGIDYKEGSSIGGAYGEGGYGSPAGFNHDPYLFTSTTVRTSMSMGTWPSLTAARNPASFGCPSTGCTAVNWTAVFDTGGWNQMRVKFYGGLNGSTTTRMQSWIRRVSNPAAPGPDNWVPVYDSAQALATPANPVGIQIHGGSVYWNRNGRGNWYRNIKIRPLNDAGLPIGGTSISSRENRGAVSQTIFPLRVEQGALIGLMERDHEIRILDASGRVLQHLRGNRGAVRYPLAGRGLLWVEIRETGGNVSRQRLLRL